LKIDQEYEEQCRDLIGDDDLILVLVWRYVVVLVLEQILEVVIVVIRRHTLVDQL